MPHFIFQLILSQSLTIFRVISARIHFELTTYLIVWIIVHPYFFGLRYSQILHCTCVMGMYYRLYDLANVQTHLKNVWFESTNPQCITHDYTGGFGGWNSTDFCYFYFTT